MLSLRQIRVISALRRIEVWPSIVQFSQPRAWYIPSKKLIRDNMKLMKEDKKLIKESGEHLPEILEEMEAFEAHFGQDPASFERAMKKEEEQRRHFIKQKIIEKKHFKPPQEVNLLTWDAKEQIRYLHCEFPDEWTLDKLADSFPISVDGLQRLLKSKYVPRNSNELFKHDLRVRKNWLALKDGSAEAGGPLAVQYHNLVSTGKMRLLPNAAGHIGLPMPDKQLLGSGEMEKPTRKVGRFEAIVRDYIDQKKNTETKKLNSGNVDESDIGNQTDKIKKLLHSFLPAEKKKGIAAHTSMFKYLQERTSDKEHPDSAAENQQKKLRRKVHDFKHAFKTESRGKELQTDNDLSETDISHEVWEIASDVTDHSHQGLENREEVLKSPKRTLHRQAKTLEEFQIENSAEVLADGDNVVGGDAMIDNNGAIIRKENRRGGRTLRRGGGRGRANRVRLSDLNSDEILKFQMEGTKKLGSESCTIQNETSQITGEEIEKLKGKRSAPTEYDISDHLKYDDRKGQLKDRPDVYLYSDKTGYQYPYGKRDKALDSIDVPDKIKKHGRIFKKGNAYYDDDGEFLYRTP